MAGPVTGGATQPTATGAAGENPATAESTAAAKKSATETEAAQKETIANNKVHQGNMSTLAGQQNTDAALYQIGMDALGSLKDMVEKYSRTTRAGG